jgi:hypothetical protein
MASRSSRSVCDGELPANNKFRAPRPAPGEPENSCRLPRVSAPNLYPAPTFRGHETRSRGATEVDPPSGGGASIGLIIRRSQVRNPARPTLSERLGHAGLSCSRNSVDSVHERRRGNARQGARGRSGIDAWRPGARRNRVVSVGDAARRGHQHPAGLSCPTGRGRSRVRVTSGPTVGADGARA